jgi:hypothetical protein
VLHGVMTEAKRGSRRGVAIATTPGRWRSSLMTPTRGTSPRARGPFAAHGSGDPKARIYALRDGEWRARGWLPEPLPAMPYALVATDGCLFAGLADGELWESSDRGESWRACPLEGDTLRRLNALAYLDA